MFSGQHVKGHRRYYGIPGMYWYNYSGVLAFHLPQQMRRLN